MQIILKWFYHRFLETIIKPHQHNLQQKRVIFIHITDCPSTGEGLYSDVCVGYKPPEQYRNGPRQSTNRVHISRDVNVSL